MMMFLIQLVLDGLPLLTLIDITLASILILAALLLPEALEYCRKDTHNDS